MFRNEMELNKYLKSKKSMKGILGKSCTKNDRVHSRPISYSHLEKRKQRLWLKMKNIFGDSECGKVKIVDLLEATLSFVESKCCRITIMKKIMDCVLSDDPVQPVKDDLSISSATGNDMATYEKTQGITAKETISQPYVTFPPFLPPSFGMSTSSDSCIINDDAYKTKAFELVKKIWGCSPEGYKNAESYFTNAFRFAMNQCSIANLFSTLDVEKYRKRQKHAASNVTTTFATTEVGQAPSSVVK